MPASGDARPKLRAAGPYRISPERAIADRLVCACGLPATVLFCVTEREPDAERTLGWTPRSVFDAWACEIRTCEQEARARVARRVEVG